MKLNSTKTSICLPHLNYHEYIPTNLKFHEKNNIIYNFSSDNSNFKIVLLILNLLNESICLINNDFQGFKQKNLFHIHPKL